MYQGFSVPLSFQRIQRAWLDYNQANSGSFIFSR